MTASKVKFVEVDEHHDGQRIDNFLLSYFNNVPKSRVYRALRSGEVRVNKGRVKPLYRVQIGDRVRIPPLEQSDQNNAPVEISQYWIEQVESQIIYENEYLLVINKPAGIAVHSGTGDRVGVIEAFRSSREHQPFLELAHRIDKETSGCLVLAKSRRALLDVQASIKADTSQKKYVCLVQGRWQVKNYTVSHALDTQTRTKVGAKVVASQTGKRAQTTFTTRELLGEHSLMSADIMTGRTHQIRVHAQQEGYPIAGDKRYGNFEYNRAMQKQGLTRMFLHAEYLKLRLDSLSQTVEFHAPLPGELKKLCKRLRKGA